MPDFVKDWKKTITNFRALAVTVISDSTLQLFCEDNIVTVLTK